MRYRIIEDNGWYYVKTSDYGLFWADTWDFLSLPIKFAEIECAEEYILRHFDKRNKKKKKPGKSIVKEYGVINGDLYELPLKDF